MKLMIFDVSNIFYRAFFGNEKLSTSEGFPTQGLYGFVQTVRGIMKDHSPDFVAFAMEGQGKTFRHTLEPLYKANRPPPPEDLVLQREALPELLQALNYPIFRYDNREADDTIATLARLGAIEGHDVIIVSSDKDFNQLVSNKIQIFNLTNNSLVGPNEVFNKYGIWPYQFLDYLSIVGDTSDNVRGVMGIGPKGASKLLTDYHSLDGIYLNLPRIAGANHTKLAAGKEAVYKAKQLISFIVAPLGPDFTIAEKCVYNNPSADILRPLLRKYEFKELEYLLLGAGTINVAGVEIGLRK